MTAASKTDGKAENFRISRMREAESSSIGISQSQPVLQILDAKAAP
jgi:hypothetical protein